MGLPMLEAFLCRLCSVDTALHSTNQLRIVLLSLGIRFPAVL